ncbi:MATE family efflux transporter [Occallatibacter riparius]|uniref:Multidrug-efflux transporter n=1 Tax=Occallatibacter riparius TaxID=1002689 RepID=A0A9J7BKS1_9BACT|nr:MATE family efflux transporter [Occallatibacter riparius]UWZ81861.1 MATE family efflux transporter [Occallatibacter riparius]
MPQLATQSEWKRELRAMTALALPVVLSELGWMLQGIVDTIMVGHLGPEAIGAVAIGNAVYYVPSLFGIGLLLGLDTLVAQAYGRDDHDACHHWLAQGVYLAFIVSPPLMILLAVASLFFGHVGIHAEVALPAGIYLRVIIWGTLPLLLYGAARRYLQGVGQVRVVTVTLVLANLLNWLGNWVLIYGKLGAPAMGVPGSALSTVFARIGMAAALLGFAWRYEHSRGHPLFARWAKPSLLKIKQLARLGAPAAGQIVAEVGAWNLVTFAAGFLTPVELATHTIALSYASLTYMVPLGVGAAAAVGVGHAIGAEDRPRARRAGWLALALGISFMFLAGIVLFLAPRPLIAVYTTDARVMETGPTLLLIAAAFQIFDGVQTVATGALRGLGETRVPMIANLIGYWLIGLPLGFVLCFWFKRGVFGLWIGLTLALIIIAAILLHRWNKDSSAQRSTIQGQHSLQ